MPIDQSKLVLFPAAIQQPIIDPNTGIAAAGGWIEFTQTDQTTAKAVYKQTGDPNDPFAVANDLTPGNKGRLDLNNAGAPVEFPLFLYPYDETDNKTEQLYFISVKRADGSEILNSDDMPLKYLNGSGSGPDSDEGIENLFPSYGFEAPAWSTVYDGINYLTNSINFPAWGWVWYLSNPSNAEFSYTFTDVFGTGLTGNPQRQINLVCENYVSTQSENWFAAPVGYRNDLVGQECEVIVYNQDNSTLPVTTMDIYVIYAQSQSTDEYLAPISVGQITMSPGRTQRTLQFTFPDVPAGDTAVYDRVLVGFGLPLNQAFNIGLTGTFTYPGQDKNITVPLGNLGERIAIARNANPKDFNNTAEDWRYTNLPKVDSVGRTAVQNRTGTIFAAALTSNNDLNYAHLCDGSGFVRGEIIKGITLADRILDNAGPAVQNSPNAFSVTNLTATGFDVELVQKGHMQSDWSTNIANLTLTKSAIPSDYGITGVVNGGDPTQVDITFNTNFSTNVDVYNFSSTVHSYPLISASTLPAKASVVNWFGTLPSNNFNPTSGRSGDWTPLGTTKILVTTTQFGSGVAPAEATVKFGALTASEITSGIVSSIRNVESDTWTNVPYNYLAFLKQNTDPMPNPPPYVISFKVDGKGVQIPAAVHNITVQLESADLSTPANIATKLANELSEGDKYALSWSGSTLPPTGEWIKASTAHQNLIFIYWDEADTEPTNPEPDRSAILIKYATGTTLAEVIKQTSELFASAVGGFPSADTLEAAGFPALTQGYKYYMEI